MEDAEAGRRLDGIRAAVLRLPGGSPRRGTLRADAASLVEDVLKTRWLLIERAENSKQQLFPEILITWTALIFNSLGYNAPRNATALTAFFLSAGALAACIFLIVEIDTPFEG